MTLTIVLPTLPKITEPMARTGLMQLAWPVDDAPCAPPSPHHLFSFALREPYSLFDTSNVLDVDPEASTPRIAMRASKMVH